MPIDLPPAPHATVDWGIVAIFAIVYLGMFLGGLPKLKLDRSGVALLGAIAVIGIGALDTEQAARAVDLPTIVLLFSFMVGSIANLIVVDIARNSGIEIDWRGHARIGVPITLITIAIIWLWLRWTT